MMNVTNRIIRLSAMHGMQVDSGAVMVEKDGWRLPSHYTAPDEEAVVARSLVGMCDISPIGKVVMYTDDMDVVLTNTLGLNKGLEIHGVAAIPSLLGTYQGLLARMARDEVWVLLPPDGAAALVSLVGDQLNGRAHALDVTSGFAAVRILGPDVFSTLMAVTDLDVSDVGFPNLKSVQGKVAEVPATLVRKDWNDLSCFDLYFGREYGEYMWHALLEVGVTPIGLRALELTTGSSKW